jgi:Transcription factor WhiB
MEPQALDSIFPKKRAALRHAITLLHEIKLVGPCFNSGLDFYSPAMGDVHLCKAFCHGCPLEEKCLDYALRFESHGIWGGMTERERVKERRRRHIPLLNVYTLNPRS